MELEETALIANVLEHALPVAQTTYLHALIQIIMNPVVPELMCETEPVSDPGVHHHIFVN